MAKKYELQIDDRETESTDKFSVKTRENIVIGSSSSIFIVILKPNA